MDFKYFLTFILKTNLIIEEYFKSLINKLFDFKEKFINYDNIFKVF